MNSPLLRFLVAEGDPTWRQRAESVVQAADRQAHADAINSTDVLQFPDGSVGMGITHQRSRYLLACMLALLAMSGLFLWGNLRMPPADGERSLAALVWLPAPLASFALLGLLAFSQAPGAKGVIVVSRQGGYAVWRRLLRAPAQRTFDWTQGTVVVTFATRTKYNSEFHSIGVSFVEANGRARALFGGPVDEEARKCWLRFSAILDQLVSRY